MIFLLELLYLIKNKFIYLHRTKKTDMKITNQKEFRKQFWNWLEETAPEVYAKRNGKKSQNQQPTDVRVHFTDFLDMMYSNGLISEKSAYNWTL